MDSDMLSLTPDVTAPASDIPEVSSNKRTDDGGTAIQIQAALSRKAIVQMDSIVGLKDDRHTRQAGGDGATDLASKGKESVVVVSSVSSADDTVTRCNRARGRPRRVRQSYDPSSILAPSTPLMTEAGEAGSQPRGSLSDTKHWMSAVVNLGKRDLTTSISTDAVIGPRVPLSEAAAVPSHKEISQVWHMEVYVWEYMI